MKSIVKITEALSLLFIVNTVFAALFWPGHIPYIADDILLPFALIHLGITFFQERKWRWIILLFCSIAAWGLISDLIANNTFRTVHIGVIVRWVKWPVIIVTIANLSHIKIRKKQLISFIIILFLALSFINLILLINPFQLGEILHMIYSPKTEVLLGNYHEFGAFRLSGTMLNPNNNAVIFGLMLIFFLSLNQKKFWKYCLLAFFFIFLTQSRTVLIIVIALVALSILVNNTRKNNMILIPSGIIGLLGMLFIFRSTNLMSILSGDAFISNSWINRMAHYSIFFDSSSSDKILGHGVILDPIASAGMHFDSEYLSILYQFGIVGLVILALLIVYIPFLIKKITGSSFFGWLVVLFVAGIAVTNFVFLNVEVITLLSLLLGTWLFLNRTNKLYNNPKKEAK